MTGHTRIEAHISTIEVGDRIDHAGMVRMVETVDTDPGTGHVLIRWTDGYAARMRPDVYVTVLVVSNRDVPAFVGAGDAS